MPETQQETAVETRKMFRKMLSEPGLEIQPAIYDPLSAKLAEKSGFGMLALGGYAMGAHTAITEPLMSLEEVAQITRQITLVSKLPLMVVRVTSTVANTVPGTDGCCSRSHVGSLSTLLKEPPALPDSQIPPWVLPTP